MSNHESVTPMRKDIALVLVFSILSVLLWCLPSSFSERVDTRAERVKGVVLSEDSSHIQQHTIIRVGAQMLDVKALEGTYKGRQFVASNQLQGRMDIDKIFAPGDDVLLVITSDTDGRVDTVVAQDHYRLGLETLLLALFALLLLLFGGWTGAKAMLSFVFTGVVLWKLFIPGLLNGYDPVLLALGIVALLTAVIIFLVAGISSLGFVAYCGSMLGVGASCVLACWATKAFSIHGAVMPFAETLLYSGYAHLDMTKIFVAAIFVAASGAVMDIAMDVAASVNEVVRAQPEITRSQALFAGIRVGRAVVGTMTTTLLLAYSGGYVTLLMAFMAQGVPLTNMFNLVYVAAEVVKTLVGSFGLVLVAPCTAFVAACVFTRTLDANIPVADMSTEMPVEESTSAAQACAGCPVSVTEGL